MKKIKIEYTWHDLGQYARGAVTSLLTGFCKTLWAVALTIANALIRACEWTVGVIRAYPCFSVATVFIVAFLLHVVFYASVKTKLNTAVYQRDSIEQKLDSIKVLYGDKIVTYQAYKDK